jgi:glutamate N-acetyltransferase/amino-acid N-acetyltransferase
MADETFNRITVDGDTSTNDCVFLLSSGSAGGPVIESERSEGAPFFESSLKSVMASLARQIVADAEGGTRTVTVEVRGAADDAQALSAARAVANSPLVKTAIHGADANWGRVMAALGRSGASFDPYRVDLYLDQVHWVKDGVDNGQDKEAGRVMRQASYTLACDLSGEYILINGSYRS